MMRRLLHMTWLLLAAGCGGGGTGGGTSRDAGGTTCIGGGQRCQKDADCSVGRLCLGGCCAVGADGGEPDTTVGSPNLLLSPTELDFGAPPLGVAVSLDLTLANVGDGPLHIALLTIVEDDDMPEFESADAGDVDWRLAVGGTQVVTVTLLSLDGEEDAGTLEIDSDDPDGAAEVPLLSAFEGIPNLAACVLQGPDPFEDCADPEEISFDGIAYGTIETRDVALHDDGDGNRPIEVRDVLIPDESGFGDLFDVELFVLGDGGDEVPVTVSDDDPWLLAPASGDDDPNVLYARVSYSAFDDGGTLPPEVMRVVSSDPGGDYDVPIVGAAEGCPAGYADANGLPQDGCEAAACPSGMGDCNGDPGDGCETPVTTLTDCGACGAACALDNAGESCASGSCEVTACDAGFADCDGLDGNGCETSLASAEHCGACGVPCALSNASESCATGTCVLVACDAGFGDCDGDAATGCEVSLTTLADCAACGAACDIPNASESCATGSCTMTSCSAGFGDCNGGGPDGCETPLVTLADCGACGAACALANASETCASGSCEVTSCGVGYGDCDGAAPDGCETPLATTVNCGACGLACALANASETCAGGTCTLVACDAGFGDCDGDSGDGCEAALTTLGNCGACGTPCDLANASESCTTGACTLTSCGAGFDNCDGTAANGCETSLASLSDCGACGAACTLPNATESCATGACAVAACDGGFGDCNGTALDGCEAELASSAANCGACGDACTNANGTTACVGGACSPTCALNYGDCDGDPDNGCEAAICGGCGSVCDLPNAVESCASGSCELISCLSGWGNCDGVAGNGCELSLATVANCGACGTTCGNPNGTTSCIGGVCTPVCSAGFGNCDGDPNDGCETSLTTLANCGTCGAACALASATESCGTGSCVIVGCSAGFGNCDGAPANGCEVALSTTSDCGACGATCTNPNGSTSCSGGLCAPICSAGYGSCDGNPSNGCETALTTLANCGGCGVSCALANASESCATGTCALTACTAGFGNCDGAQANGCEASLSTTSDCGACGATCTNANGSTACTGGVCTPTCAAGYGSCDGDPSDGCETNLTSDAANCGACGAACSNPNGSTSCVGGACNPICAAGFGNCDADPDNGCEASLSTLANCGFCGTACALANATESCAGGACTLTSCDAGYGNCDGFGGNGCETALTTTASCGACGTTCTNANGSTACTGGACAPTCSAGFASCDADPNNGCETSARTLTNCGACGTACALPNAAESCASGTCTLTSCDAGFGNCDGGASNGCEVPLTTTSDCGACGTTCTNANGSTACVGGTCTPTCAAGYGDCNGNPNDGCETPLNTLSNCGGCGLFCDLANATESCATGTCTMTGCSAGFGNCDGSGGNGCEAPLTTLANCGGCGTPCALASAAESCSTGTCTLTACDAGFGDCNLSPADGCELSTTTTSNCGTCGTTCTNANGSTSCTGGVCTPTCSAAYGSCDANPNNGCETSLTTLPNCGSCGTACALANATESCATGTCTLGVCSAGFGNCDGVTSTGCETSIATTSNCGACGTTCTNANGSTSCTGGVCTPSCSAGFASCDGDPNNGCETNLNASITNCGACGTTCTNANGTTSCSGGTCSPICSAGYGNCDGSATNGCEQSLTTLAHCGACGAPCDYANASESCATGTCTLGACSSGYGNCDGVSSNGCETALGTPSNCSSCGNACAYSCISQAAGCQFPDTCAAPYTISGVDFGPTAFSDNMSNYAANVAGSCGAAGDDAIHQITIPTSGGNTNFSSIVMDSAGSAIDTASHITTTCGSAAAEQQYASVVCGGSTGAGATCANSAGTAEVLRACGMPSGTYYATLDSTASTGAWTLSLTVDNVTLDTCVEAGNVSNAPLSFTQTTSGKTDDYWYYKPDSVDNTCPGPSTTECARPNGAPGGQSTWDCSADDGDGAVDAVFYYRASASGYLTLSTSGSSFDTMLYVKTSCMAHCSVPSACLACNDDHNAGTGATWSQIYRLPVTAGTLYYVFVDGNGTSSGTFTLAVTFSTT